MKVDIEPGMYVLAASGGVDSMVLLDILRRQAGVRLVVAHFDHGIRPDSELDRQLVQAIADSHGLAFVFDRAELGAGASEAEARKARYAFLHRVREATGAQALITAHHQDDLLETAILNLLRGTGRKGLSSLADTPQLRRPLLGTPKEKLIRYAKKNGLKWREDLTNQDPRYVRNHIRQTVMPALSPEARQQFLQLLDKMRATNAELDEHLRYHLALHAEPHTLDRKIFTGLPHAVAREVMAAWLRSHDIRQFDAAQLEKLVIAAKTLAPGKRIDVDAAHIITLSKEKLALEPRDR